MSRAGAHRPPSPDLHAPRALLPVALGLCLCAACPRPPVDASDAGRPSAPGDAGPDDAGPDDAGAPPGLDAGPRSDAGRGATDGGGAPDGGPAPALDGGPGPEGDAGAAPPVSLTFVTLNTHSFQEGPASVERLQAIGQGLADLSADVVGLNEVVSGPLASFALDGLPADAAEIIRLSLEGASGQSWQLVSWGFAHWDTGELMANALLSRHPVVEEEARSITTTDFWPAPAEARNVGYARLDVPAVGLVNVFVTHAWGWDSADTEAQVLDVKAFMVEKFRGDEALDVLLGDLNTPSTWPHHATWLEAGPFRLIDRLDGAPDGGPATLVGDVHRVDYVLAGQGWPVSEDPTRSEAWRVFDGEGTPVVSDHHGVLTRFFWP